MAEAPSLMEDLVEEILLRFSPDDSGSLLRAALVSKSWCRLVSSPGFNRRFHVFHHRTSPPLLGFFYRLYKPSDTDSVPGDHRFMPLTSSFRRLPHAFMSNWGAVDARHGRILFYDDDKDMAEPGSGFMKKLHLIVWNPIKGEVSRLPVVPMNRPMITWSAALLCDNMVDDNGLGPFRVVLVATVVKTVALFTYAYVYSSEQHVWSTPVSTQDPRAVPLMRGHNALIGNTLYFSCRPPYGWILEYDLSKKELYFVSIPPLCDRNCIVPMTAEDGGLGFAVIRNTKLYTWSRKVGLDGAGRWSQQRVFELDKLLASYRTIRYARVVAAENALSVIFVRTSSDGLFVIDLKFGRVIRKIDEHSNGCGILDIVPYSSFCTPAVVGSGLLDEGPRAGDST